MVNSAGYEFDENARIVRVDTSRLANLEDSLALSQRLVHDSRIPLDAGFIIDLRAMRHLLQFDEIYQLMDWHKGRGLQFKGRFAFLVDRPATVGTANIFCTLLHLHAIEADMFDSDELALAWLSKSPRSSGEFARSVESGGVTQEVVDVEVAAGAR